MFSSKKLLFLPVLALSLITGSAYAGKTDISSSSQEIQQEAALNPQPALAFPDEGMPVWYKALASVITGATCTSCLKSETNESVSTKLLKFAAITTFGYFLIHQMDNLLK